MDTNVHNYEIRLLVGGTSVNVTEARSRRPLSCLHLSPK